MADRSAEGYTYSREVRDTVVKSGLGGIAATVFVVGVFSPAGLGQWIGTSLASGGTATPNDNVYANLPAYPAPLTADEVSDIRGKLASTAASLEFTRAATDARIEHIRSIALGDGEVTFAPMPAQPVGEGLRLTLSEPVSAPAPAPAPIETTVTPASYGGPAVEYRDPHLELADLLLAHENF